MINLFFTQKIMKKIDSKFISMFSDPDYFFLLSPSNQNLYNDLRISFSENHLHCSSQSTLSIFVSSIHLVQDFVHRYDENDSKRALVCGLFWKSGYYLICTKSLSKLLSRSKSSINSLFSSLGYSTFKIDQNFLSINIPLLKNEKGNQLKKWVMKKNEKNVVAN
jgi:hypothetical protein